MQVTKKITGEQQFPSRAVKTYDYIEESHEAIIPPDEFDAVQAEIERRKEFGGVIAMQTINENKRHVVNPTEWAERSKMCLKRHNEITVLLESLDAEKAERISKSKVIAQFIKSVSKQGTIAEFDDDLWFAVIENVIVNVDGSLTFKFKNVIEIKN